MGMLVVHHGAACWTMVLHAVHRDCWAQGAAAGPAHAHSRTQRSTAWMRSRSSCTKAALAATHAATSAAAAAAGSAPPAAPPLALPPPPRAAAAVAARLRAAAAAARVAGLCLCTALNSVAPACHRHAPGSLPSRARSLHL